MTKQNDDIIQMMKEIIEAEFSLSTLLLQEYKELMDVEITTKQAILLEAIYKYKQMTVREIAEHMHVSSSAVSQLISKLEKSNYVKRAINPNNRREILVELDQAGERYFAQQRQAEHDIIERFYTKLTVEEVIQLKHITFKLKGIVEEELAGQD